MTPEHDHPHPHHGHDHGAHERVQEPAKGAHDHGAGGHDHSHVPADFGTAFAVGVTLNLAFVVIEFVYGGLSRSMALVADAGHNLGDVLGLGLAWGAAILAKKRPTKLRTYGFRGSTILASLTNSLVLLFVTGGIAWEAFRRFFNPEPVGGLTVVIVALVGVVVNGVSALLFAAGRKGDLNIRSAFLHLASDAGLALGVAAAGLVMMKTGWTWLDPTVSIALSIFILVSTWKLLRDSANLALGAVPDGIDAHAVEAYLAGLPGVIEVHDLHIWAMSTTENALTAHVVVPVSQCGSGFLGEVCEAIHERFGIEHTTLQLEMPDAPNPCALSSPAVV